MKLSDICDVYSGYALKEFNSESEGFPVIKIGNILANGSLLLDDCQYSKENINEKYFSKYGDIYVALSGATTGKIGIMLSREKHIINQRVGIVRKRNNDVPESYIKYFLLHQTERILNEASGCAQPNISPKQIALYEVPNFGNEKILNIVSSLDKISNIIDFRKQQLQQLDELVKARFVEMFGDLVFGDKYNNNKCKIGDIASVTKLAGFEFTKYIKYKEQGDIIMLRGLNCKKGHLVLDDIKWIDKETSDLLPRSKLYYGDILMTYAGTIGDVAMVDADDKYHLAPNVAKITLHDKRKCNPMFLIHLFMYSRYYIMTFASQVAQASINMEKIRSFEYFFPPIDLQNQFAAFVEQIDKSKVAVQKALDEAQTLFDSLMQEYFG